MLCSFLSGMILSQSGSFIQLGTQNILASPSTLGMDGLAILWMLIFHSLCLYFGVDTSTFMLLSLGITVSIFVGFYYSSHLRGALKYERLILLGLTFNLLVGAIFSLWQFLFLAFNLPFPVELWFGHFRFADMEALSFLALTEVFIILGMIKFKKDILLYSLGPSVFSHFPFRQRKLFQFLFISVAIGTFVIVAEFGAFSFLALLLPILARRLWFRRFDLSGELIWGSILNGILLMTTDFVCYNFPIYGAEIPVGLIVTAIGAMGLVVLLWSANPSRNSWQKD